MLVVVFFIVWLFVFASPVAAVNVTITNFPVSIDNLDQFQVTASVSGATNATNYLRIDLFKDGTNNYFGETYNGSSWYGGSDGKSYFPIEIKNSSASGVLQARLGKPSDTDYPGPGEYKLRIRRYTASGNSSLGDDQDPVDVHVTVVFSTSSTDPTPSQHGTIAPNPTPIKTPTPIPAKTMAEKTTPTPSTVEDAEILGVETANLTHETAATSSTKVEILNQRKFPFVAVALIAIGFIIICASCFVAFKGRLR